LKGITKKYVYSQEPKFSNDIPSVLIDTREQFPIKFKDSKLVKLSCGDYTTTGSLYSDVFIERKSLPDLVGTLTSGLDRFKREVKRASDLGYYLVVLVEDKFENALNWSPDNSFSKFANGKYIFYRIREISNEYENIQFVFADSRENAKNMMIKIFQLKDQVKFFDLEYLKDFKYI
jgi:ERCC4-type nuclease